MKKTILLFFAITLTLSVCAQDTIHTTTPPENYYYSSWNKYKLGDTLGCTPVGYYDNMYKGLIFYTPLDTLKIYGIAIGAVLEYSTPCYDFAYDSTGDHLVAVGDPYGYYDGNGTWHLIGDSALDESYMDFVIMQTYPNGTVVEASDSLRLHMMYDTPAYYVDMEFTDIAAAWGFTCDVLPVYEVYFDSVVTVLGKFYMGGYNHSAKECIHHERMYPEITMRGWIKYGDHDAPGHAVHWSLFGSDYWEEYLDAGKVWEWFFPILTPNPDSTFYDQDDSTQTSVQRAVWERYVGVQPNPATDKVTVLSSVGLEQVEVFDMAGNRVLLQEASGLSAKLNIDTLPHGTYIVRIHTPLGTTSRKLVVQR